MGKKYDRRFEGQINAGLRAAIRRVVSGHRCGPANEASVMSLAGTIALTAQGLHTLALVAADYRAANGERKPSCDCDACYAGNLQALGALS